MPKTKKKKAISVHHDLYRKIALNFFIVSIILFFAILYVSKRKAVIKITPNYEIANTEFIVDVKENASLKNELKGRIMQIDLADTVENLADTEIEETLDKVESNITIINNNSREQKLVATTRFLTEDGILFRLKNSALIPANEKIEAAFYADDASAVKSAIAPGKLTIPGLGESLQEKIYGELDSTIDPEKKKVKVITNYDIEKARDNTLDILFKKVLLQFAENAKTGEKILSKGIDKEIIKFEIDKKEGDRSDKFICAMNAKFTAVLFDEDKLFNLAKTKLSETMAKGRILVNNISKDNLIYSIEKYDIESKTANIRVMLAGKTAIDANNEILAKENFTGLSKEEALAYFKMFKEIKNVEIEISPSWWEKIPRMKSAIKVSIAE
ncbi:MAG: hypothetical protein V1655_00690 [bacterium]